ncbi:Hypothetical protein HVR_LOCUS1201 [uncultured virus]|nr:Hypothetical protein HVR_LOCUS1201 [uncultured virus]
MGCCIKKSQPCNRVNELKIRPPVNELKIRPPVNKIPALNLLEGPKLNPSRDLRSQATKTIDNIPCVANDPGELLPHAISAEHFVAQLYNGSACFEPDKRYISNIITPRNDQNSPREGTCIYRLHRGIRRGQSCGRPVISGTNFCSNCS